MISSRLEKALGIPRSQRTRVGLLFMFAFWMSGAYVSARASADALFLARSGADRLPAMILVSASGVALVTVIYSFVVARWSLQRVVMFSHLILGGATFVSSLFLGTGESVAVTAILYLLAEIRGALGTIHFATLLNELFQSAAPKKVTGIAGAGSTLAGILFGSLVAGIAADISAAKVLMLIPILDVLGGLIALRCRRIPGVNAEPVANSPMPEPATDLRMSQSPDQCQSVEGGVADHSPVDFCVDHAATGDIPKPAFSHSLQALKESQLARYLAGMVCLKAVVVVLIEFQWKTAIVGQIESEQQMVVFFGVFYAVMFFLTGVIQLFGTSAVLTKLGVRVGLAAFPLCVALVLTGVFWFSTPYAIFWCVTLARGCDIVRRGLTDPAIQVLYWPLGSQLRRQVIALIGGWIKPFTEAVTAVLLIPLATNSSPKLISLTIAALCVVWLAVIYSSRRNGNPDRKNSV